MILLDVEAIPSKRARRSAEDPKKTTFVSFSGVQGARTTALELCQTADRAARTVRQRADRLRELSDIRCRPKLVTLERERDRPKNCHVDELRQRLRCAGLSRRGRQSFRARSGDGPRRPSTIALLAALRVGALAALLLGPAAADWLMDGSPDS